jgi:DNA polymerase III subunit beta
MKFVAEKENLVKALNNVNGAVGKKNITIPILLNIRLEAKDDMLSLTGTDLNIAVSSHFKTNIEKEGVTTAPAQLFFDIARKIPDGSQVSLSLNADKKTLEIKYGKSKFKLPCLSADEFPVIEEGEINKNFTMNTQDLLRIIDKSRFAISSDETRYYLNGIYFHSKDVEGKVILRGATTDGHRLAIVEAKMPKDCEAVEGVIIPKKTVGEIRKILETANKTVKVSLSKTKIKVESDDAVLISKLIDGEFPNYEKVIPIGNDKIATINKKLFADAIDRVSTVAIDKHRAIKLNITKDNLKLEVETNDGSSGDEEIKIQFAYDDVIETGFNSRYMLDILAQINKENVVIKIKDGNSPVIIQGEDEKDALFVLMPVRI